MRQITLLFAIFLILDVFVSVKLDPNYTFQKFKSQFGKNYAQDQAQEKKRIFENNYQILLKLSQQGYDVRANSRLDQNLEDKEQLIFDQIGQEELIKSSSLRLQNPPIPQYYNWHQKGMVTSVKDQGLCNSCALFAAAAFYESYLAKNNKFVDYDLSQQYIGNCLKGFYNCSYGSSMRNLSFSLDNNNSGIPLEISYPYSIPNLSPSPLPLSNQSICHSLPKISVSNLVTFAFRFNATDDLIQKIIYSQGVSIIPVVSKNPLFSFAGPTGLINCQPQNGSYIQGDHVVIIYGYNKTHWFIKNSHGKEWGNFGHGYILKSSNCISRTIYFPYMINDPEPIKVTNTTVNFTLLDTFQDGWEGTEFALKQNGQQVGLIGDKFTSGSSQNTSLQIKAIYQTQLVVHKIGLNTEQIIFVLNYFNKTFTYVRSKRILAVSQIVFTFCPGPVCQSPTMLINIQMVDSIGDGWDGTIIALRQQGKTNLTFALDRNQRNRSNMFLIKGNQITQIVVLQFGRFTEQIGFTIKAPNGSIIFTRTPGKSFEKDIVFHTFCPLGNCDSFKSRHYIRMKTFKCNGWGKNILGIMQNGKLVKNFTMKVTDLSPVIVPFDVIFRMPWSIVVVQYDNFTQNIGFQILSSYGQILYTKEQKNFSASEILYTKDNFTLNQEYIHQIKNENQNTNKDQNKLRSIAQSGEKENNQNLTFLIPLTALFGSLVVLLSIAIILLIIKIKSLKKDQRTDVNLKQMQSANTMHK